MILRQYLHTDPVVAISYLFGCAGHAAGGVVDPVGDPEVYLDAAAELGLRLRSSSIPTYMPIAFRLAVSWPRLPVPNTSSTPRQRPGFRIIRFTTATSFRSAM